MVELLPYSLKLMHCIGLYEGVRESLEDMLVRFPELFHAPPSLVNLRPGEEFRVRSPPRADKMVYYSLFIHGMFELGRRTNYDKGVLFEAVFVMGLTPCPEGWYTGVMNASERRNGGNLACAFIESLVEGRGSVSAGFGRRRQPSSGASINARKMFMSTRNMIPLVGHANVDDDTVHLLASWAKSPERGGVEKAGALTAQEQINVITGAGELSNATHRTNAQACKGTATYAKLGEMGFKEDRWKAELFRYLAHHMNLPLHVVENLFCEFLRHESGNATLWHDTFVRGQSLYELDGDVLYEVNANGARSPVTAPAWTFDAINYERGIRWWDDAVDLDALADWNIDLSRE